MQPAANSAKPKTPQRSSPPEWLVLIYTLTVMLFAQTVYRVVCRRGYARQRPPTIFAFIASNSESVISPADSIDLARVSR